MDVCFVFFCCVIICFYLALLYSVVGLTRVIYKEVAMSVSIGESKMLKGNRRSVDNDYEKSIKQQQSKPQIKHNKGMSLRESKQKCIIKCNLIGDEIWGREGFTKW